MAKDRETPCKYYESKGVCKKGREAEHIKVSPRGENPLGLVLFFKLLQYQQAYQRLYYSQRKVHIAFHRAFSCLM